MSTSNVKELTDCDKIYTTLKDRIKCEEKNLEVLTSNYAEIKRISGNRLSEKDNTLNEKEKDNRLNERARNLYAAKVGICILVFMISLLITFLYLPMIPNMVSKSDIGMLSVVIGISAGIITAIIFVVDDNLKTQRLIERTAAKRFEIKMKRSKLLSLMQQDAAEDENANKSRTNTDDDTGENNIPDAAVPNDVHFLNNRGLALDNLGKYEEAIDWYDKALAIDPNYVLALNNKGYTLYHLGKYEEAIDWYDKALAIDPNYVLALNNRGLALDNLGEYEEAIDWYDKALAIDPNNGIILNNKRSAQEKIKKKKF